MNGWRTLCLARPTLAILDYHHHQSSTSISLERPLAFGELWPISPLLVFEATTWTLRLSGPMVSYVAQDRERGGA